MKLSSKSLQRLAECEPDLQTVMIKAIERSPYEFQVNCGYRSPEEQKKLFDKVPKVTEIDGFEKLGKHNVKPSMACDIVVYVNGVVTWDEKLYKEVGNHIMSVADSLVLSGEIKSVINWGGDWKKFKDYPHFEI